MWPSGKGSERHETIIKNCVYKRGLKKRKSRINYRVDKIFINAHFIFVFVDFQKIEQYGMKVHTEWLEPSVKKQLINVLYRYVK